MAWSQSGGAVRELCRDLELAIARSVVVKIMMTICGIVGVILFELVCGYSPFYAPDAHECCRRIVRFVDMFV